MGKLCEKAYSHMGRSSMKINYTDCSRIDLGCGKYKREGYTGIDRSDFGQEIIWDIRGGIPLPDDSVKEIYCSHLIEHLTKEELQDLMEEIKRVCSKDATIILRIPHSDTGGAYDYSHRTVWNEKIADGYFKSAGFNIKDSRNIDGNLTLILGL